MHPNSLRPMHSILVLIFFLILAGAATAVDVPRFHVHELVFAGPTLGPADKPIETVEFSTTWQHESGSPSHTSHGFWDGDGAGGGTGNVFKIRFTPTKVGVWELKSTQSNAPALDRQKEGTKITCVESDHHGFWEPDGIWFKRTDGVHQYVLGNVHYCLVIYDKRIDDVRGNAQYYKRSAIFLP